MVVTAALLIRTEPLGVFSLRRTTKLSDRRWKRAQAVSEAVHESRNVKTETLSGGSLERLVRYPIY